MVDYILSLFPAMLAGMAMTLKIFFLTLMISLPCGLILALVKNTGIKIISRLIAIYIWVMRGTPLMLQIVFLFFGLPLINLTLDRFIAVVLAFALNYTAYFGEIFRGGINSIDKGQYEAGLVLGFNRYWTFKRIVFPQVFKNILPSLANEIITLIKDTSLVYVVGLGELLRAGKIAANRDVSLLPLVLVGFIYLVLTGTMTIIFNRLEDSHAYYE